MIIVFVMKVMMILFTCCSGYMLNMPLALVDLCQRSVRKCLSWAQSRIMVGERRLW